MNYVQTIADAVLYLIEQDGVTTTKDIKEYLIENIPTHPDGDTIIWRQKFVSVSMNMIQEQGMIADLTYSDNGTYRTYYTEVNNVFYMKRKELVALFKDSKGRFAGAEWIKKDGSVGTANCRPKNKGVLNDLGYIDVSTSKGKWKMIDPRTLYKVTKNGNIYLHKSLK